MLMRRHFSETNGFYLTHKGTEKDRILLSVSGEDLDKIINERINLLEYIDYKIMDLTANFKNGNFEMFKFRKRKYHLDY